MRSSVHYAVYLLNPNHLFLGRSAGPAALAQLRAGRPILAGEEILISYLAGGRAAAGGGEGRRRLLREQYGFECCCEACQED